MIVSDTNSNWRTRYSHQMIARGTRGPGNKKRRGDHPKYSIVVISQSTEKNSEDLRRLAVTENPVENHQITMV